MRAQASASADGPVREPAWPWPVDLTRYDRSPTLLPSEAEALAVMAEQVRQWRRPRERRSVWRALDRLVTPLRDVRATLSTPGIHQRHSADIAVAALLRMCAREHSPYWAWSASTWIGVLGATQPAFHAVHPPWVDRQVRHYVIALAYLLDCFTDLGRLGNYKRLALAEKIFGPARIQAVVTRLATVLVGWGYQDAQEGRPFRRILCEILLINRSPRLNDLTPTVLDTLRRTANRETRTRLFQLQRALAALGLMEPPEPPVVPRHTVQGVAATWIVGADRWEATSTLAPSTRRHVHRCVLKAGRWLAVEHPAVVEPAAWTRDRLPSGDSRRACRCRASLRKG